MAAAKKVATLVTVNGEERVLHGVTPEQAEARYADADGFSVIGEYTQKEYDAYLAGLGEASESATATVTTATGAKVPAHTTTSSPGGVSQTHTASATLTHEGGLSPSTVNPGDQAGSTEQDEAGNPIGGDDEAGTLEGGEPKDDDDADDGSQA